MKLDNRSSVIESDFESENSNFSIENPGMVFEALSTHIYKNPSFSVLSELGANSFDAHIEANKKNIPFEVYLPTYFEPILRIKDFGTGMSHEFMMNSYTKLMYSTKNKSNNTNGAFGIGRLSLLSLQDTFTAISIFNGKRREYVVYKDNGLPKINLISEKDTTEENGFEVSINVNPSLIENFKSNATRIFKYYPVKPKIYGAEIEFKDTEYIVKIGNVGIKNVGSTYGGAGDSSVLMGVYSYKIDINNISGLDKKSKFFLEKGIDIEVDIGDVSVNLSRDGLFYDEKTIKKIKDSISEFSNKYEDKIESDIKKFTSKFKAASYINKNKCLVAGSYGQFDFFNDLVWNGEKISDSKIPLKIPDSEVVKTYKVEPFYSRYYESTMYRYSELSRDYLYIGSILIYDDIGKSSLIKKKLFSLGKKYGSSYMMFRFSDKAAFESLLKENQLEEDDFIKLSSVEEPEDYPKPLNSRSCVHGNQNQKHLVKYTHFLFNGKKSKKSSNSWDIIDPENLDQFDDKQVLYTYIDRFSSEDGDIFSFQSKLDLLSEDVYIIGIKINNKGADKFPIPEDWEPINKYIPNKIKERAESTDPEIVKKYFLVNFLKCDLDFKIFRRSNKLESNSSLVKEVINYENDRDVLNFGTFYERNQYSTFFENTDFKKIKEKCDASFKEIKNEIKTKYPLLSAMTYWSEDSIKRYIWLEDSVRNSKIENKNNTEEETIIG